MAVCPDGTLKAKMYAGGDFEEVTFQGANTDLESYVHAAHGMLYAEDGGALWDGSVKPVSILMQFRFDGNIGFPGGMLDKGQGVESVVDCLNRELEEEIGLNVDKFGFVQKDHVFSHKNAKRELVCHFYAKKVSKEEFLEIEKNVMEAHEWGIETMGTLRVPLYVMKEGMRGLPVFLTNRFAGNAKYQLIEAIRRRQVIPEADLDTLLSAHKKYSETKLNF